MTDHATGLVALRTSDLRGNMFRLACQRLLGEPSRHLPADATGQLLDLRERDVAGTIVGTESGVEWVIGGSGEIGVSGALYIGIGRGSERHNATPSMDSRSKV